MVRLSADLVNDSYQFINACKQREICLRNLQIPAIENLGATRDQFDVIDLTDNNIRKLNNLPQLKRLESLILHNNRVQSIQKDIGEHVPNLKTLALTNNNLAELSDIDALAGCKKLEYLTLMGNPLTHKQHYRAYIIHKLKSVRVLDFRRIKDKEREAAKALFRAKKKEKSQKGSVKTEAVAAGNTEAMDTSEPPPAANGSNGNADQTVPATA
ncbi:U2 small nuclear ribonucleoprotein A [Aphelenchoides avenae]|nr:U2 small nuclear ribonucleoprotein A [Aphelenchus avenae]